MAKIDADSPLVVRSLAQKWASERNWLKRRLASARSHLGGAKSYRVLTPKERRELDKIVADLDRFLKIWPHRNDASKNQYLRRAKPPKPDSKRRLDPDDPAHEYRPEEA